jgi:hypothetical protein
VDVQLPDLAARFLDRIHAWASNAKHMRRVLLCAFLACPFSHERRDRRAALHQRRGQHHYALGRVQYFTKTVHRSSSPRLRSNGVKAVRAFDHHKAKSVEAHGSNNPAEMMTIKSHLKNDRTRGVAARQLTSGN